MTRFTAEALAWLADRRHTLAPLDRAASVAFVNAWYAAGSPCVEAYVKVTQELLTSRVEECRKLYVHVPQTDHAALVRLRDYMKSHAVDRVVTRDLERLRMLRQVRIDVATSAHAAQP